MTYVAPTPLEWTKEITCKTYEMIDVCVTSFSSNKEKALYNKKQKKLKKKKKKNFDAFLKRISKHYNYYGKEIK